MQGPTLIVASCVIHRGPFVLFFSDALWTYTTPVHVGRMNVNNKKVINNHGIPGIVYSYYVYILHPY